RKIALFGLHDRAHRVIRHRHDLHGYPELARSLRGKRAQRSAFAQKTCACRVHCKIAVAELEPVFTVEAGESLHEIPGFAGAAPSAFRVGDAAERIKNGVEIGRNVQPEMLEVVAGVDDDGQLFGCEHAREAERELGAANAAAQRNNVACLRACHHRNKSISFGRNREATGNAGASQLTPRTCTAGRPSAACPITSDAAAAISSATATSVTRILRPNRSCTPTMSRNE